MKSNDKLAKFGAMYRMLREAIHLVKRFAQDILNFTIHYIYIFLFRDNETAKFRRPLIVLRARAQRRLKALKQEYKKIAKNEREKERQRVKECDMREHACETSHQHLFILALLYQLENS